MYIYIYIRTAEVSERKMIHSCVERTSEGEFQGMKLRNEKNNIFTMTILIVI